MVDKSISKGASCLGIFAKQPLAGKVKTRLTPPLSSEEACELYRVSLCETVSSMAGREFEVVLFFEGNKEFFQDAFPEVGLRRQGEGGLGERMDEALCYLLDQGYQQVALIGSDSPDLPPSYVEQAFESLKGHEFVTIPSRDGGYVLVGQRRKLSELFQNIPWSTEGVLSATREKVQELGVCYGEVEEWEDMDDIHSLRRLVDRSPNSATAKHALSYLSFSEKT